MTTSNDAPRSLAADEALAYLDKADEAYTLVDQLYKTRTVPDDRRHNARIAQGHALIGRHLKFAQVHAMLAVADAIRESAGTPVTVELDLPAAPPASAKRVPVSKLLTEPGTPGEFVKCEKCGGHLYLQLRVHGPIYTCDGPGSGHTHVRGDDLGPDAAEEYDHTGCLALYRLAEVKA
jgi:hypothetical protein